MLTHRYSVRYQSDNISNNQYSVKFSSKGKYSILTYLYIDIYTAYLK